MALISARTAGLPSLGSFYDDAVDGAWCAAEGSVFQRPPLRSTGLNIGPVSGDPFKASPVRPSFPFAVSVLDFSKFVSSKTIKTWHNPT